MLKPPDSKGKTYADRPMTPLGVETGLTSTPVSEQPSPGTLTPRLTAAPNPYHYQPAIASTRPELTALRRGSTNYAQAHAESLAKLNSPTTDSPVTFSPVTYSSIPYSPVTFSPVRDSHDEEDQTYVRRRSGRAYSFSAEDLKRSHHEPWMTDDDTQQQDDEKAEDDDKDKRSLQSPGIGNSEVKGREFGFTSAT